MSYILLSKKASTVKACSVDMIIILFSSIGTLNIITSLGAKYHYLWQCWEYMELSAQSIEALNKTYGDILNRYNNQRFIKSEIFHATVIVNQSHISELTHIKYGYIMYRICYI